MNSVLHWFYIQELVISVTLVTLMGTAFLVRLLCSFIVAFDSGLAALFVLQQCCNLLYTLEIHHSS